MKKIFTLIAVLVLSTGAFAQQKYTDLVENGHMEQPTGDDWSCFWCHEWRNVEEGQFAGFANIVEDPLDPSNHCAKVVARSSEEAYATETAIEADGHLASWDSQFFVYVKQAIESGKMLRLTMRVRADKPAYASTQAHFTPGDYNHWQCVGNVNFTEEWTKFESEIVVTSDMTQEGNEKEMHSIAFNLAEYTEGNVYYFDDIKLEVKDQTDNEITGWMDFITNGNLETDDVSNFTGRDAVDGVDRPARIVVDTDGKRALNITAVDPSGWNVDDDGNPTSCYYMRVDEEGNETQVAGDDWLAQFFVTIKHTFRINDKYKFVMWARADKPARISSQIHRNPGDYLYYQMIGDFELTEEWQRFEVEGTIDSNQAGGYTIAFNSYILKEANNYYFRDIEFCVNEADVSDLERTLGSESVTLPVPLEGTTSVEVDMDNLAKVLGVDVKDIIQGDNMRIADDEGNFGLNKYSAVWEGAFFNMEGAYDESGTIILELGEDVTEDNKVNFIITNLGEPLGDKEVNTRICFEKSPWFYAYDVKFVDINKYNDGIAEVSVAPANNVIYDISGRRVNNPTKGIYIVNGKKFIK